MFFFTCPLQDGALQANAREVPRSASCACEDLLPVEDPWYFLGSARRTAHSTSLKESEAPSGFPIRRLEKRPRTNPKNDDTLIPKAFKQLIQGNFNSGLATLAPATPS